MTGDRMLYWEADRVDVPSTSTPAMIAILRGGESITLTSKAGQGQSHYIGPNRQMTTTRSYQLEDDQSVTLTLPVSSGKRNYIEIWALAETAGADICIVKLYGEEPKTEISS